MNTIPQTQPTLQGIPEQDTDNVPALPEDAALIAAGQRALREHNEANNTSTNLARWIAIGGALSALNRSVNRNANAFGALVIEHGYGEFDKRDISAMQELWRIGLSDEGKSTFHKVESRCPHITSPRYLLRKTVAAIAEAAQKHLPEPEPEQPPPSPDTPPAPTPPAPEGKKVKAKTPDALRPLEQKIKDLGLKKTDEQRLSKLFVDRVNETVKEIRAERDAAVTAAMRTLSEERAELARQGRELVAFRKLVTLPMSKAEYRQLRGILHSDRIPDRAQMDTAFNIVQTRLGRLFE